MGALSLKETEASRGSPGFFSARGLSRKAAGLVKIDLLGRRIGLRWEPTRAPTQVQDRRGRLRAARLLGLRFWQNAINPRIHPRTRWRLAWFRGSLKAIVTVLFAVAVGGPVVQCVGRIAGSDRLMVGAAVESCEFDCRRSFQGDGASSHPFVNSAPLRQAAGPHSAASHRIFFATVLPSPARPNQANVLSSRNRTNPHGYLGLNWARRDRGSRHDQCRFRHAPC